MGLRKFHEIVTGSDQNSGQNENEQTEKNEEVFAELVQYLDDRSKFIVNYERCQEQWTKSNADTAMSLPRY